MLTDIQKARTRFHLGYPNDQIAGPRLEIEQNLVLSNLAAETELALVGDGTAQTVLFQGLALCAPDSMLDRLETTWSNIGPAVIDDSLFVKSAGSVTLRGDELRARKALYNELREQLATLLNVELFREQVSGPHDCY